MGNHLLNISGSTLLLVLFIVLAILFSIYTYRYTVPQIPNFLRRTLMALRSIGLILLIFALFEPIVTFIKGETKPPRLRVLLDNSISAGLKDARFDRKEQMLEAINNTNFQALNKKQYDVALFDNSYKIVENFHQDSLKFDGQATNISSALRSVLKDEHTDEFKAILLISDGSFNEGANPLYDAEQMGIPIFVVPIGDTVHPKDIALQSMVVNEVAYVDNPLLVNVNVQIKGFDEGNLKLKLLEDNVPVADKDINFTKGMEYFSVSMEYTPKTEGIRKLTAVISGMEGEITTKNNQISDYIKVLKNKRIISIFSGSLSPDVSFVVQHLALDKNIEVKKYIQKQGAEFYDNPPKVEDLDATEMFIFINFPISSTPDNILNMIGAELEKAKPLLFIAGYNTDYNKLRILQDYLPFTVISSRQQEFLVIPDVRTEALSSPIIRISGTEKDLDYWNKLPPIFRTETFVKPKPEAEIISYFKMGSTPINEPLVVSQSVQNRKCLAVIGYGLYRWKLLGYASDVYKQSENIVDLYSTFLNNSIKWLSTDIESRKFRVKSSKKNYVKNEIVEFLGYVYDDALNPIDDANVIIKIHTPKKEVIELALSSIGNGRYYTKFQAIEDGDYHFTAEGSLNSRTIGKDQGRFNVGEIALEYMNLRANIELLREIAQKTGGRLLYPENASEFLNELKNHPHFKEQVVTIKTDFAVWNNPLLLALAILIFGIEWYIRKKSGLL